jgi:hypothetical protein
MKKKFKNRLIQDPDKVAHFIYQYDNHCKLFCLITPSVLGFKAPDRIFIPGMDHSFTALTNNQKTDAKHFPINGVNSAGVSSLFCDLHSIPVSNWGQGTIKEKLPKGDKRCSLALFYFNKEAKSFILFIFQSYNPPPTDKATYILLFAQGISGEDTELERAQILNNLISEAVTLSAVVYK